MGSVQQMLTVGAIIILTLLILSSSKDTNYRFNETYSNEAIIIGSGIAQSIISEIQSRAFDENVILNNISTADSLTSAYSLGPEYGELTSPQFNDIDDFNGFAIIDSVSNIGNFYVLVLVYYVSPTNPEVKSLSRTFCKKIDVSVSNNYLPKDLVYSLIISY